MVSEGSKCVHRESQDCGLVPGAQWGSPPTQLHSQGSPGQADSRWRGALQRRTQPCLGAAGGAGSGANQKLGKMIWMFSLSGRSLSVPLGCSA